MVAGEAWVGDTPAAWMTPAMLPSAVAASTRAWTDAREETSTMAELAAKPASCRTFAAASACSLRRSASSTRLPALIRRAIAWPIDPAPMTTVTWAMSFMAIPLAVHPDEAIGHPGAPAAIIGQVRDHEREGLEIPRHGKAAQVEGLEADVLDQRAGRLLGLRCAGAIHHAGPVALHPA